ncbi:MAG: gamma-glutamyltransferase family protein [Pseudomonadota bacterium]
MRDFSLPGRSALYATQCAVATSHPLASQAALDVLKSGGNAVDAGIAAVALLGIVEPQMTGVGGDCFALYLPAGATVPIALNGSGRAPAAAHVGWYQERGITSLDPYGPHAVTVPGAVAAWCRLLADHGTRGMDELLLPAIRAAEHGHPVAPRVAYDWARDAHLLRNPAARELFLPGGAAPAAGTLFRQPRMAETLRAIARDGRDGFYRGAVAEDIVATLRAGGGQHTLDDLDATAPDYVTPLSTDYRGHTVYECPPNGQGLAVLMMLNVLSGHDLSEGAVSEADRVHLLAEVSKLAYAHRDALFGDTTQASVPVDWLLGQAWAAQARGAIDMAAARPPTVWPEVNHKDTVYLCVVDREGNTLSLINSIFHSFGSTLLAPKSGVLLHNRGANFSLQAGHPNSIGPGKRPVHTIIPGMLMRQGQLVAPFGVMGGQYQATGHVALLSNLLDRGLDPQAALDAPRSFCFGDELDMESGLSPALEAEMVRRGHRVLRSGQPIGGGQLIWRDAVRGVLIGGSDPRKDGCALGY